jgi:hypothetical protein
MADLAPKTNSNPNFESKFGFLVKFYPNPELGLKKSASELKKMNLYPFFSICGSQCKELMLFKNAIEFNFFSIKKIKKFY